MKKRDKIAYIILVIILAGGVAFYFNKDKWMPHNNNSLQDITADPFADIVIPDKFDEATKAVIQEKIDKTKEMYNDKPDIWETWIAIGNLRAVVEDYQGAIDAYRQSIIIQSNNILGYKNIAEIYRNNLKDYEKAKEYYGLAIENNFADPDLYIALALVQQYKLNDIEGAEQTYLDGLEHTRNNFEILNRLITFYQTTGNTEKLNETKQKLKELYPNGPENQNNINVGI